MTVAVVTGAARGIGAAIAVRLARDGMDVAVVDLTDSSDTERDVSALGRRASGVGADVTCAKDVDAAFQRIEQDLGPVQVLVNNAGVTRDALLFRMSEKEWSAVLDVHLTGAFLMTRRAQAGMVEAGWGRIVSLSSVAAHGNRGQVNYSAAKAGIIGFARTAALELGPFGITSNVVAPGYIDTPMLRAVADRTGREWGPYAAAAVADLPVRRMGTSEDVAAAVAFLASREASYITGEVLNVGGGLRV